MIHNTKRMLKSIKTMKTIIRSFIPSLILILCVMTSCEKEPTAGNLISSDEPLTFTIGNEAISSTRGVTDEPDTLSSTLLCTIPVTDESGMEGAPTLFISSSVSSLDDEMLLSSDFDDETSVTRGTPVFTENLGSFAANTYAPLSSNGTYSDIWCGMKNAEFAKSGNVWSHNYTNNEAWPDGNGDLVFFMRYPVSATSGLSGLSYARQSGKNVINLTGYTTPAAGNTTAAATNQTDLVFATVKLNESNKSTANKLLFYHPFCGVKFKVGNLPTNLTITNVTLENVYAKGDCVVTPYYGNDVAYDKINSNKNGDAITKSAACVAWSSLSTPSSFGQNFTSGEHKTTPASGTFPSDFNGEGTSKPNQNQLNTTSLSKTFNLIPQEFTSGRKLTMKVTFSYNGTTQTKTTQLGNFTWQAGNLYTYTISFTDNIDVEVTDEVNGNVKSNVVITNTGNMPEYIRAVIVGNWFDSEGSIVAPWSAAQGSFTGLANSTYWYTGADGYYYYMDPVAPGAATPTALFTTYTAPTTSPVSGAHLEIKIVVQAVIADKNVANAAWGVGTGNLR